MTDAEKIEFLAKVAEEQLTTIEHLEQLIKLTVVHGSGYTMAAIAKYFSSKETFRAPLKIVK